MKYKSLSHMNCALAQTLEVVGELRTELGRRVRSISFKNPFGESVCLSAAVERARGRYILTSPQYVQVDPVELRAFCGLSEHLRHRHIAWDIGTFQVARYLSARFDAAMIYCGFSRLLIDPNRSPVSIGVTATRCSGKIMGTCGQSTGRGMVTE